ncbi:ABC-type bacteriocin/lantibiotic exporter, contains an N-terminal double-glycine peptidase domain [Nannocystis exedens]|uniref:ABC-type bacteriocin/lantibiotic exporter, contains an N-terminal double-glycine peptidase domain n=1 Tax=Nannocystis exedens TaxID=54 RepID=A0A1I2BZY2_9BACT|nr:ABC transporter ATP-binding protein [Nannocystis exedens]PCC71162.1 putative ABC transporter ATP-binding protein [Nannocystis exedens]SFE61535.1 ABC-type bacteriocin/lantibiotic exporter, contains an N-terminal double-glycine peptidase domain [Nannocystis exedens]
MYSNFPNDPTRRIPGRLLEVLAEVTGHALAPQAASRATQDAWIDPSAWVPPAVRAARLAGLKAAQFTVQTAAEITRLSRLDSPAFTLVGKRWLVLRGARHGVLDLVVFDELGEHALRMRAPGLLRWLAAHHTEPPMAWLAVEPRLMFSALSHAPTAARRLLRAFKLERRGIYVVLVYGVAMAVASLAIPIATQALVDTIAATAMLRQIVVLAVLLAITLGAVAVLRVLQILAVERIHRRLWVRGATDWIRRLAQTSRTSRRRVSNRDLSNRFLDVALLQKDFAALLLSGSSLVLVMLASLVLLAFYHPVLFAFDAVLILGIGFVVLVGLGAKSGAKREANARWDLFAWMDDVASNRLTFADPRGRALSDVRGELLLRDWLDARAGYFRRLLRHVVTGAGLEVIATVAVLGIGGWLVVAQELTLGQLVAASVLVSQIGSGVGRFARQLDPIYEAIAAVDSMGKALDADLEPSSGEVLPRLTQPLAVELQDGAGQVVLSVKPGGRTALVGASDSHSRALDLLYGLFGSTQLPDLSAWLDGREVHLLEIDSLRDQVALVRGGEVVCTSALANLVGAGWPGHPSELDALLDLVDLRPALNRLPQGMQQDLLPDNDDGPLTESEVRRLVLVRALIAAPRLLLIDLGLDRLGLSAPKRAALLDWIFDRRRPWTLVVVTDSVDSRDILARCDHQQVIRSRRSDR